MNFSLHHNYSVIVIMCMSPHLRYNVINKSLSDGTWKCVGYSLSVVTLNFFVYIYTELALINTFLILLLFLVQDLIRSYYVTTVCYISISDHVCYVVTVCYISTSDHIYVVTVCYIYTNDRVC